MSEGVIRLIFLSCEGYGLQAADMLRRIVAEREVLLMNMPIVYLVDKNGMVVCTIVKGQTLYESQENYDRRSRNCFNGFDVEWSPDGKECTVTCRVKRKAFLLAETTARVMRKCGLVGTGVGAFFGYLRKLLSAKPKEKPQSPPAETESSKPPTKTAKASASSAKPKEKRESQPAKDLLSQAREMKTKLHAITCDKETLSEVSAWWQQRSDEEVAQLRGLYDFSKALGIYSNFFKARRVGDVQHMLWFKSFFSKQQVKVIVEYASSDMRFNSWRREMGMSFSKPYELNYIKADNTMQTPPPIPNQPQKTSGSKVSSKSENEEKVSREDLVRNEALMQKKKLWSMDCSRNTVDEVEEWRKNLSNKDKQIARSVYEFTLALRAYKRFFIGDVSAILLIKGGVYFSKEQIALYKRLLFEGNGELVEKGYNVTFKDIKRKLDSLDIK